MSVCTPGRRMMYVAAFCTKQELGLLGACGCKIYYIYSYLLVTVPYAAQRMTPVHVAFCFFFGGEGRCQK